MTVSASVAGDADRRADLRRMKRRATGLLVAATVVFVAARWLEERNGAWGYLRATAEAAMVGGLADWFAVTALFRHPLGLPIPHTAIIPERKEQLGRTLGGFVEEHFLTADLVAEKLRAVRVGHRTAVWLGDPGNRATAERQLATAIGGAIEVLRDDEVQEGLEQAVLSRIRQVPAAPVAGQALELMTADGRHHDLVTSGARAVVRFIEEHRLELRGRFGRESPWWVPEPIDDRIFEKLFSGLCGFLAELADDPDHLVRDHLDRRLVRLVDDLRNDPAYRDRGEALKDELLAHPAVRAWTATLWQDLKAGLLAQTADPGSELRRRIGGGLEGLAATLADDPDLQAKVDRWVESAVRWAVETYRGEVSELIAVTVARWDPSEASERIEVAVGRDLQFIRINGTIVGGLAGLVIHSVGRLIG